MAGYKPRITLCRLHTGGKSIADLRERYKGQGLTYRELETVKKSLDLFDGVTMHLSQWEYDGGEDYHVLSWEKSMDARIKEAVYWAEQTNPWQRYLNDRAAFERDWEAGEYDPGCSFTFCPQDVEELAVIQEEQKEEPADDGEAKEKVPPRWRQIKEKQARRKRRKKR
ncbi:MAG: hypothetical protein HFE80_12000 [Clostridiaceae bacterium]|jgi:hypothetical protein|nr:hypothetical protein [Clostridiaceae bacterium]